MLTTNSFGEFDVKYTVTCIDSSSFLFFSFLLEVGLFPKSIPSHL